MLKHHLFLLATIFVFATSYAQKEYKALMNDPSVTFMMYVLQQKPISIHMAKKRAQDGKDTNAGKLPTNINITQRVCVQI